MVDYSVTAEVSRLMPPRSTARRRAWRDNHPWAGYTEAEIDCPVARKVPMP
jgi:hypothetical protein